MAAALRTRVRRAQVYAPPLASPSGTRNTRSWMVVQALLAALGMAAAVLASPAGAADAPVPGASADAASAAKVTGFFDGLGAYTYADPEHWSRAVARLQLSAQGRINENVTWKLGGRVDVDPLYFGSDFYSERVRHDQRARFYYRENYLDVSAGNWDFRLGAQQIVWGEVAGLFFADVVSARDMRDFLLPSFDVIRIPQWAARAEYFSGDNHLELVWIPVPVFDQIGKPGSDFYPAPLPPDAVRDLASSFRDPVEPSRRLGNGNYGIRANSLLAGWDVAGFYYRSYSTSPTFYAVPDLTAPLGVAFEPRYDRIWQAGTTVSKDFDTFVLRGEAVYTHGQGYTTFDLATDNGVVRRNSLDYIVSAEWSLPHESRINLQAFERRFVRAGSGDVALRTEGFGATVLASTKLNGAWEPQIMWIQGFEGQGGLVRPRLNWYPAKNTTVGFGADIFTGPEDGLFGRYGNRDRVYTELRYDF